MVLLCLLLFFLFLFPLFLCLVFGRVFSLFSYLPALMGFSELRYNRPAHRNLDVIIVLANITASSSDGTPVGVVPGCMRRANVTTAARQARLALMTDGPAFSYDRGFILVLSAEQSLLALADWPTDLVTAMKSTMPTTSAPLSRLLVRSVLSPPLPLSFRLCISLFILICRRGAATASSSSPTSPLITHHCRGRCAPGVRFPNEGH